MPELPEVETIVRELRPEVKNRKITGLWTDWPKYFKLPKTQREFEKHIIGKKIADVERRGKNILFVLSDDHLLLIHQKLSGHLLVGNWHEKKTGEKLPEVWQEQKWIPDSKNEAMWDDRNRFIRLIFYLDDGRMLALSDLRRFAKVLCGPRDVILNLPDLKDLGPEALNLSQEKFQKLFEKKKGVIKQVLMDQNFIAGIGNIYSDEILWSAKIHPKTKAEDLTVGQIKTLYEAMREILTKALRLKGASVDDYRIPSGKRGSYDKVRFVYQREDEPCPRCRTPIKRIKLGSRSAHFCPKCQKS